MKRAILLIILIPLFAGCAMLETMLGTMDGNSVLFRDNRFDFDEFRHSRVAVLPAQASDSTGQYHESLLNASVARCISELYPTMTVYSPNQINRLLSSHGLVHEYADMIRDYREMKLVDGKTLKAIEEETNIRYLLYLEFDSSYTMPGHDDDEKLVIFKDGDKFGSHL